MSIKLYNKNILIISPENWGKNFVSKHHYAFELSQRSNNIYFLNRPSKNNKITPINDNLNVIDYKPRFRGLRRLPQFISAIFTKLEIKSIEKRCDIKFDIIWNFDSSRFFNLSLIKDKFKIAHLVDLTEYFERPLLCKSSDICLCTSEYIKKEMEPYNQATYNIGHGVITETKPLQNKDLKEINKFKSNFKCIVGYVGNLTSSYIDWSLLYDLVKRFTDVGFIFIGSTKSSNISLGLRNTKLEEAMKLKNVFFTGEKDSLEIIPWLKNMDVLLLIYKADSFKEQLANPHKVLEYLKSGKVIIATWTEEYINNQEILEMCETHTELINKFEDVIANLTFYNAVEKQKIRIQFAERSTYKNKINQIEKLLSR